MPDKFQHMVFVLQNINSLLILTQKPHYQQQFLIWNAFL